VTPGNPSAETWPGVPAGGRAARQTRRRFLGVGGLVQFDLLEQFHAALPRHEGFLVPRRRSSRAQYFTATWSPEMR